MNIKKFKKVPESQWPNNNQKRLSKVFLSEQFLVQLFKEENNIIRLTICRVKVKGGMYVANITWDELQEIKSVLGYGDYCAVEIYPEDNSVVNVANMRHLWVLPERPDFAWGDPCELNN